MSTFKRKQHVGEKVDVMSSQGGMDELEAFRLSDGWGRKVEVVFKLKLVIKTLVFLNTYKTVGNIILTLSQIFTHYSLI